MSSRIRLALVILAVAVALVTAGAVIYLTGLGAVDKDDDKTVMVNVPEGSGGSQIVAILDEAGLVKNTFFAKVHVRINGYDTLQANTYMFSKSMTVPEMFEAVNTGDKEYVSREEFTIIEGGTLPEAAAAIAEKTDFSKEEIMKKWSDSGYLKKLIKEYWFLSDEILGKGIMFPLEGYLYPATYFITDEDATIDDITADILDETDRNLSTIKKDIEKSGRSVHEFLSLASVVENESFHEEDRSKIAGVFENRLEDDMPLQSDSTVLYAKQETRINVSHADLKVDSPYNTYKNKGIPVGPICNPSLGTLEDVLDYEDNDYLYFFAKEDGTVLYTKTYEEHKKVVEENKWY